MGFGCRRHERDVAAAWLRQRHIFQAYAADIPTFYLWTFQIKNISNFIVRCLHCSNISGAGRMPTPQLR